MNRDERLDPDTEDLLWQLAALPTRPAGPASHSPFEEELLERYRRGELTEDETSAFERRIADDKDALERMAEISARTPEPRRLPL